MRFAIEGAARIAARIGRRWLAQFRYWPPRLDKPCPSPYLLSLFHLTEILSSAQFWLGLIKQTKLLESEILLV